MLLPHHACGSRAADLQRRVYGLYGAGRCVVQLKVRVRVINAPHLVPDLELPLRDLFFGGFPPVFFTNVIGWMSGRVPSGLCSWIGGAV